MPFFCYILECTDGSYYTGWSVDPQRRLLVHNTGNGARYTRIHRPVRLVYVEEMPDRSSAQKRELAIKRMDHAHKSKLIEQARLSPVEINQ
jgi:putative endonuclease